MILSLILFLASLPKQNYSHQTIAIGIWAGKETLENRVLNQAKTWMRFWEEVHVFTDELPENSCEILNKAASPCKVHCVKLGNYAEHLEGTEWTHRWYFAQPRFLPAMASLYEHSSSSDWFLFGDDDTYFFRPAIERKKSKYNHNTRKVIGKFWSTWAKVTDQVEPKRDNHPFAQGGAGVLLSHEMMKTLAPHLVNCTYLFNDADFAGSMRFAICVERVVGIEEWSPDRAIHTWYTGFHSSPPEFEISDSTVSESPASFHRIMPNMFEAIAKAHYIEYKDHNGRNLSADLALFSFTPQKISLGRRDNVFEWRFGFWISLIDSKTPLLKAKSGWIPSIDKDGNIVSMKQEYEGGVTVTCECDDTIPEGKVYFSHFNDYEGSEPVMKLSCSNITVIYM